MSAVLSLSRAVSGGESCSFVSGSHVHLGKNTSFGGKRCSFVSGSHIHLGKNTSFGGNGGIWLKPLHRGRLSVSSRIKQAQKHEYPWPDDIDPNIETGHLAYLSHFKPLPEKPKPVTLPFEKPLLDLEKKIIDVRRMAEETGLDFTNQINLLEIKYQEALKELYTHLSPIQRLTIARHPNRPTFLDHILNITDKWVELHGDRAGYDDPAIVTGIGSMNGKRYLFIGHQKGRNTKENIQRNFGMPTPHGYRKALRMMKYADHHGFPIITFIDTPGAYADIKSEELGQGEAIAHNLRTMFGLKVPIVTVVIGEGGSGGALAIGCANKLFMLENSVFYVASPEACAAILWKSSQEAPKAAEKLKITATELCKLKIADGIIPEPLGGAHTDPAWASQQIKLMVTKAMEELAEMDTESLLSHRHDKFRRLGGFVEGSFVEPEIKRNMKKKDTDLAQVTTDIEIEIEKLKKAALEAKFQSPGPVISSETIEQLKQEVEKEMTDAFVSMGLEEKLESLQMELSNSHPESPDHALSPLLKEKVDRLMQEFNHNLSRPGAYLALKQKLKTFSEVNKVMELKEKGERLKREINEKLQEQAKGKIDILEKAREKVARGEKLDEDEMKQVNMVQEDMKEMLKSMNLEVVGFGKKTVPTAPPNLEEKFAKADEVIKEEIAKAIDLAGLRSKMDELKAEIAKGSSNERLESLGREIREGILATLDLTELKMKVGSSVGLQVEEAIGASEQ